MSVNKSALNQKYRKYQEELIKRFWDFQQTRFQKEEELFERPFDLINPKRPPVFKREQGKNNVLVYEVWGDETKESVRDMIPKEKWHRWFPSMTSSQALAQSVFGNLKVMDKLGCLGELKGDEGRPLFIRDTGDFNKLKMEHEITFLDEPRRTKIDVFLAGDYQVAVECKLSEKEVGTCSRPRLSKSDEQYCNGTYSVQDKRTERCALTQIGVKYWKYIPEFFSWDPKVDQDPCPLNETYQLVRNVLAAGLKPASNKDNSEDVKQTEGHTVLLYDERNPEFFEGGKGFAAWKKTKEGLKEGRRSMLQKCSWQQIILAMKSDPELSWVVNMLHEKYGF
jgi:hypothetical protein